MLTILLDVKRHDLQKIIIPDEEDNKKILWMSYQNTTKDTIQNQRLFGFRTCKRICESKARPW